MLVSRIWPYIALAIITAFLIGYGYGFHEGNDSATHKIEFKTLTKTVTIQEKHREIRARRPDTDGIVKRLQDHSF